MFSVVVGQHKLYCQMWSMATFMMCDDIIVVLTSSPLFDVIAKFEIKFAMFC